MRAPSTPRIFCMSPLPVVEMPGKSRDIQFSVGHQATHSLAASLSLYAPTKINQQSHWVTGDNLPSTAITWPLIQFRANGSCIDREMCMCATDNNIRGQLSVGWRRANQPTNRTMRPRMIPTTIQCDSTTEYSHFNCASHHRLSHPCSRLSAIRILKHSSRCRRQRERQSISTPLCAWRRSRWCTKNRHKWYVIE